MRSTTTTIETNIPADRLVDALVAAAGAGAAGVLVVSEGGATGAAAEGVLTGSGGAVAAVGVSDGFRSRADRRVG
jgi:hypothetical protein